MTYVAPKTCHFVYLENGEAVLIPGCWGTIHGDRECCTCNIEGSVLENAFVAKANAEELAENLRLSLSDKHVRVVKMSKRNNDLRQRIYELERAAP